MYNKWQWILEWTKVNEFMQIVLYTIMTAQSESSGKVVRGRGVESAEDEEKG